MAEYINFIDMNLFWLVILAINLAVAMVILVAVKLISAFVSNINANDELAQKDNHAFGISIAGVAIGVTIMMTGVMSGDASTDYVTEAILVASYGLLGIVLMSLTRFIFDRVSMPSFSIKDAIISGNNAAAIIDAGNVIATAIIIRTLMIWVESPGIMGLLMVLAGYALSQLFLSLISFYRLKLFNKYHDESMQKKLEDGNTAIAWRFSGFRIGVALAISAASGLVIYNTENLVNVALLWILCSIIMMVLISILAVISDKVILSGINLRDEVDNQANNGIGVVQCAIMIAIGIIMASLMS